MFILCKGILIRRDFLSYRLLAPVDDTSESLLFTLSDISLSDKSHMEGVL